MPYTLKSNRAKFRDANGVYKDFDLISEQSTQAQLDAIQTAGATERTAIENKGATTRASIPADYTALSDSVDNLSGISRNIYAGKFVNTSFKESDVYSSTYKYAGGNATPIVSNGLYTFSINGTATVIRYIFLDANKNDIGSYKNGSTTEAAPSNAKYIKWRTYDQLPNNYSNMQLEYGTNVTPYVDHITAVDTSARYEINELSEQLSGYAGDVRSANIKVSNGSALSSVSFIDAFSSAMNGLKFTEDLWPRVNITNKFSHGAEMVKTSDGIFILTPTNDIDTGDSPQSPNLYTVIVHVDESNMTVINRYVVGKYGDTDADGDVITSGVSSGPIRVFNGEIYCFLTAKTDKYYQYYSKFDPASGTCTKLTKCTLNGEVFSSSRICEVAEITSPDAFICLHGLIGENNGTYYAAVALAGSRSLNSGMILATTNMKDYTLLTIPDLGNDCMVNFEIACCYFDGYIFICERQLNKDKQILAKLTTNGVVNDSFEIPDAQSKSTFFIADSALYLAHNIFDRSHVEIVRINSTRINRSQSVMVSNSENIYPFMLYVGDILYVVSTRVSSSRVCFSKTVLPTEKTVLVYNLLKTFENYIT